MKFYPPLNVNIPQTLLTVRDQREIPD